MISKGQKQEAGLANLRKKEKRNGLVLAKNRGGAGQPNEKRENKWISWAKNRGRGRPTYGKKRKQMD